MLKTALVAHRGSSHDAPENTLPAFELAWEEGADGIEADFRLTADGEIVCIHDGDTGRTTGVSLAVGYSTLAQLRELDAGDGARIPTLEEVLAAVPPGKMLFMELKDGPVMLFPVKRILASAAIDLRQIVISSFSEEVVTEAKRLIPRVKTLWVTDYRRGDGHCTPSIATVQETLERTHATGVACQASPCIDAAFVGRISDRGREIHVWTVNEPRDAAHYLSLGVDSIITDRPGRLRHELREQFRDFIWSTAARRRRATRPVGWEVG